MPELIIAETCPAPESNLTVCDVEQMVDELAKYHERFGDAFGRVEQMRQSRTYLQGLLSDLPRKTTERIALEQGVNVRTLQYFIGQSPWPTESVLAIHQAIVGPMPPEQMARSMAVMLPAMNIEDRVELLGGVRDSAPSEVFEGIMGLAASVLDGDAFTRLGGRLA